MVKHNNTKKFKKTVRSKVILRVIYRVDINVFYHEVLAFNIATSKQITTLPPFLFPPRGKGLIQCHFEAAPSPLGEGWEGGVLYSRITEVNNKLLWGLLPKKVS
jgi:hypothetical protein